ncbi:hypothetical protein O181_048283 [Austropuccinia psidii MF-1]|uniref:Reverse transcriptase domain-containing protein n=1 Tax=Austropuccinia psidii MF-1 TaxID=1389203 RepID=A0A9Q3HKC0_9BASI|nr:hypothetical protein [Austropuccinia psidii MF-1]
MKDFGEDVAISSLHLFQGDMDPPPLSFHASLEEQWDVEEEKEEIETVLNVVPPSYHQYLDVFSKVKAEKLPPHCACDNSIELENLVNDIFAALLDIFVVVYLDDIMVFFSSEEEHVRHVASVLQRLRDNNMFSKASKCVLHASSVEYLGYVVSSDGLTMDSSKVQQILNLPQPKSIKALQSFPGFASFYLCFIKNFSKKITALTSLLKKDSPCIFNEEALSQFQILKEAFTTAPILSHFNPSLSAIACWAEFLSEFHFTITYFPGRLATLPDALSCWDDVYPERGVDFISKNPQTFHQVIKQDGIQDSIFFSIKVEIFSDLVEQIQEEVWKENDYKEIFKKLERGESVSDYTIEP